MIQQIRLDDLLARDIDVKWFEAIAVIQAVCRQGLGNASGAGFPGADDIVLDATGNVSASAVGTGVGAAAAAAHLLAAMLKDDVPVRLRLIVTQATAGVGYATVEEFSEAVGYFERPDGEQVLKSLFERASHAPNRVQAPVRENATAAASSRKPEFADIPDQPRRRGGSPLVLAAIATVLVCGFALWLFASDARTARLAASFGVVDDAPNANDTAPRGTEDRKPRSERGRKDSRAAAHASDAVGGRRSVAAARATPTIAPLVPLVSSDVSWISNLMDSLAAQASSVPPGMVFYSSVEITASTVSGREDIAEGPHIYTRSDAGVIPPRSMYPKLPDEPAFGPRIANQTVLELVINPRGLVEHVKLRTVPRNIHEFMIVSAAKAWQFEPARLDGQPVRFRQLIHLNFQ